MYYLHAMKNWIFEPELGQGGRQRGKQRCVGCLYALDVLKWLLRYLVKYALRGVVTELLKVYSPFQHSFTKPPRATIVFAVMVQKRICLLQDTVFAH